ncbi:hypothetical protein [Nocardia beijingensis]|uniref:hypothetical protein n=1 Tax=Nocardia beijingensis TaxID=95162 RepID=UPI000A4827DE|nr:hypothetical protein [Nocardia beijingensis]
MNQPHDTTDDEGSPETPAASEKDTTEGRSENSGKLAGPGPGSGRDEDPDT